MGENVNQQREMETDRFDRHHVLMDVVSCYFFLLLVWTPLMIICFVPAVFSKLFARINDLDNKQNATTDDGTFGDYHRGVQQQNVKNIVDTKYNGSRVFDDDSSGDEGGDAEQSRLERMVNELMHKVDAMKDAKNADTDVKSKQSKKHKKTMNQLQKQQRQKNKQDQVTRSRGNSRIQSIQEEKPKKVKFGDRASKLILSNEVSLNKQPSEVP